MLKGTPVRIRPSSRALTYCATRMMPWESWPHRLASMRLRATTPASSAGTPRASNNWEAKRTRRSAGKVGTGGPRVAGGGVNDPGRTPVPTTIPGAGQKGRDKTMSFAVSTRTQPGVVTLDATIFVLEGPGGQRAEVWPALGFNCFRWMAKPQGQALDLLYPDPNMFNNGRPTRGGIPVLFPFPNRIRAGRFTWDGKEYQLPLNDPAKANAIHGFACRVPWRVVDQGADSESAWVSGVFRCSLDAPASLPLWPADHELRLTI